MKLGITTFDLRRWLQEKRQRANKKKLLLLSVPKLAFSNIDRAIFLVQAELIY